MNKLSIIMVGGRVIIATRVTFQPNGVLVAWSEGLIIDRVLIQDVLYVLPVE